MEGRLEMGEGRLPRRFVFLSVEESEGDERKPNHGWDGEGEECIRCGSAPPLCICAEEDKH